MIEIIPVRLRDQWLADRLPNINASEAPALLGIHPYLSPFELYVEKLNPPQMNDQKVTGPMERGILLEPVAIAKLRSDHPDWRVRNPACYYRDRVRRIGATPDALVTRPDRPGFGVIQIKSVEPGVFRRTWHNEAGEIEVPLWIAVQAAIERELTDASYAMVVPLVVGHAIDVHEIEIPHEPTLIARIEAEVHEFWTRIANRRPPEVTSPNDFAVLAGLYRPTVATIDLKGDNELTLLADEDEICKADMKKLEERRKVIKGRFLAALGGAMMGFLSDGRCIIAKEVNRKGYSVEPSSYLSVSVREPRE